MSFSEKLLHRLSYPIVKRKVAALQQKNDADRGLSYAKNQYNRYLQQGFRTSFEDKVIVEIGCGHGGICCYFAVNGAAKVFGIDLNEKNLQYGKAFKTELEDRLNCQPLPVEFIINDVTRLQFENDSIDIIIADNVLEHFDDNVKVFKECKRVLKPGGKIIAPSFPPIYSRNGAHLKNGIGVYWCNLFFSEQTVVNVLKKNCEEFPILYEKYPGVRDNPKTIRDVRKHKDLNYLTNKKFKSQVEKAGLKIAHFNSVYILGSLRFILRFVPKYHILHDIFSVTSSAIIIKE